MATTGAGQAGAEWHIEVSLLYFKGCPNGSLASQRLRGALDAMGRTDTDIAFMPIETEAEAAAVGFASSPTFLVDGRDLFDQGVAGGALTCRGVRHARRPRRRAGSRRARRRSGKKG